VTQERAKDQRSGIKAMYIGLALTVVAVTRPIRRPQAAGSSGGDKVVTC